jgi:tripartite-type tricarboxylate transporter receptor subunit TctC
VPTVSEAGLAGAEADNWHAVLMPAGTPAAITRRWSEVLKGILSDPGLQAQFTAQGAQARASTADELLQHMRAEIAKWREVARVANVRLQ